MAASVFITRELDHNSVFRERLEAVGFDVYGKSLIHFSGISFDELPEVNWIFFYSKNGVKYFFEGLEKAGIELAKAIKWAVMGQGTAGALKEKGILADFIGSGAPEATAASFIDIAKGQTVLFPRAQNSRRSVQQLINNEIHVLDLPIYTNEIKLDVAIPDCIFLVFTSPLSVASYLKQKKIESGQKVISIGPSTGAALKAYGVLNFKTAKTSSEAALAELVLRDRGR